MLNEVRHARWRGLAASLVLVLFVPSTAPPVEGGGGKDSGRSSRPQLPASRGLALAGEYRLAHSSEIGRYVLRGVFGVPHAARLRGGGRDVGSEGGNKIVMAEESEEDSDQEEEYVGAQERRRRADDEEMVIERGPMLGKRGFNDEEDPQALPHEDETTSAEPEELRASGGFWVDANGRRHRGLPQLDNTTERVSRLRHEEASHASAETSVEGDGDCAVQLDWSSDAIRAEVPGLRMG